MTSEKQRDPNDPEQALERAWRDVEDGLVPDAARLIRIPSVKEAPDGPGRPFGAPLAEALELFLTRAEELGFKTKNVDGYAGHVEMGEGSEVVGMLCHLDVVPAGDGWTFPPFGGVVENGRLYGRGACDDKGPAVAALYAMVALARSGLPVKRRIRLILGLDEESGWACMERYFRQEEMPVYAFSPDGFFPIINAEKGHVNVALSLPLALALPSSDVVSSAADKADRPAARLAWAAGGSRANVVPDLARAILSVPSAQVPALLARLQDLARARGISATVRAGSSVGDDVSLPGHEKPELTTLVATETEGPREFVVLETSGVAAHAMHPERGENAVAGLLCLLASLELEPAAARSFVRLINDRVGFDTSGKTLGIARRDDVSGELTCNLGLLDISGRQARVVLDIRYPVTSSAAQVLADLTANLEGTDVTIESLHDMPPLYVPADNFLIKSLSAAYERVTGEKARLLSMGGGTYARAVKLGVAFGPVSVDHEEMAHQKDEYIEVDALKKAGRIFARALWELAR